MTSLRVVVKESRVFWEGASLQIENELGEVYLKELEGGNNVSPGDFW